MSGTVRNAVRRGFYLDSVALMRLSRTVSAMPGVIEAALMMATPANRAILRDAGLIESENGDASANDLLIAIKAESAQAAEQAITTAQAELDRPRVVASGAAAQHPHSLSGALSALPGATLALISVPGDFAAGEARRAVRRGLDVMIFSDNVPIEEEAALKREAQERGRLVMGPDCGTAIIDGVPLAFANHVSRGDIGIVGASGTGMQEVFSLIAQGGGGISQAIGVGGRDLSREVGAISTLTAIDMLDADPATRHIVLISKPPHPEVAQRVLARVGASRKTFTVCFLGASALPMPANARSARSLRAAAEDALGGRSSAWPQGEQAAARAPRRGAIVGLYSGGTLSAEAQVILLDANRRVTSNAPAPGASALPADGGQVDRILDLGADEFTRGRPHPMIEPAIRSDMLRATLADPDVAVVLIDLVIGAGAHEDPASHVAAAMRGAADGHPYVIGSVTGTENDPQVRSRQIAKLAAAGVIVAPSNAHAVELALSLSRL